MSSYKCEHNFTKYHSSEIMQHVWVEKTPAMSLEWCRKCIAELRTK